MQLLHHNLTLTCIMCCILKTTPNITTRVSSRGSVDQQGIIENHFNASININIIIEVGMRAQ